MGLPRVYRVYGIGLESEFPFQSPLIPGNGHPDVRFSCGLKPGLEPDRVPIYQSRNRTIDDQPALELARLGEGFELQVAGVGEFAIRENAIDCHPWVEENLILEVALLGSVLSFWLELRGRPALHASAVEVDGRAVVFLAAGKGGKSNLAAEFLKEGHGLISDDIVPVSLRDDKTWVDAGYPQMRMWPEDAARVLPPGVPSRPLHDRAPKRCFAVGEGFGRFCFQSVPVGAMIVPQREPGPATEIQLRPLSRAEAVFEMTRHSFLARTVEAVGLQSARFSLFSEIARRVEFFRLIYPTGFEFLPRVTEAVRRLLKPPGSTEMR